MLALARVLGLLPPALTLIGVTMDPAADPHAPGLSPAVRAALPALIEQILAVAATALAETEVPA
jgi:Ni,Fe-hydrogenase maturation factor